jgi:hypothetical protein
MSGPEHQFSASRIVVALDSSCENVRALEMAASMAARIGASLHGIFVEDLGLLRAASLPFVRHVALHPRLPHPLEMTDIEAEYRVLAARARASLADLAGQMKVPWSFEVLRGERSSVVQATQETDLLVMETATRPLGRHLQLRTDWSSIALDCARACLLLSAPTERRTGILVVHDGTENGERAIAAGIALGSTPGAVLHIATVSGESGKTDLLHTLGISGAAVDVRPIGRLDVGSLLRAVAETKSSLVIIPVALASSRRAELQPLLVAPPCAVLLVR